MKPCCIFLYKYTKQNRFLKSKRLKIFIPKTIMYKKLMYICFQNEIEMKNSQLYKGSLNHHHEIAGGKRQDVRL
jgi:hypothetical protein